MSANKEGGTQTKMARQNIPVLNPHRVQSRILILIPIRKAIPSRSRTQMKASSALEPGVSIIFLFVAFVLTQLPSSKEKQKPGTDNFLGALASCSYQHTVLTQCKRQILVSVPAKKEQD